MTKRSKADIVSPSSEMEEPLDSTTKESIEYKSIQHSFAVEDFKNSARLRIILVTLVLGVIVLMLQVFVAKDYSIFEKIFELLKTILLTSLGYFFADRRKK